MVVLKKDISWEIVLLLRLEKERVNKLLPMFQRMMLQITGVPMHSEL